MTVTDGRTLVLAQDVRTGDDLVVLGAPHRITSIEDYQHPEWPDEVWRIASDAFGWSVTLLPGARHEVVR